MNWKGARATFHGLRQHLEFAWGYGVTTDCVSAEIRRDVTQEGVIINVIWFMTLCYIYTYIYTHLHFYRHQ